ncbi:uncharacterized protein F5147DRAFT_748576 [Suillus discolor]|uniref:Uncharacterized protein n=1 Tax=Suillus discolor TaxID=1912936 RepID=A0A9P7ERJ4_9AGAM|nr:uncharacterized protein F5147DRAFT_748576 [Suillus discolor]KAG2086953.1 hypothetical protein F5147DRAFT_748576 [Suillus discolor]
MAPRKQPLLPLNLVEATFMLPEISALLSMSNLISSRTQQLQKQDNDLAIAHQHLLNSHLTSIEAASNAKCKPHYFEPMVVVSWSQGSSYRLAEVDGSLLKLKFAAFHLIPYHPHSRTSIKVTQYIDPQSLTGIIPDNE